MVMNGSSMFSQLLAKSVLGPPVVLVPHDLGGASCPVLVATVLGGVSRVEL